MHKKQIMHSIYVNVFFSETNIHGGGLQGHKESSIHVHPQVYYTELFKPANPYAWRFEL